MPFPLAAAKQSVCARFPAGSFFTGRVLPIHPFSAFVKTGAVVVLNPLDHDEITEEPVFPLPEVGDTLTVIVMHCSPKINNYKQLPQQTRQHHAQVG